MTRSPRFGPEMAAPMARPLSLWSGVTFLIFFALAVFVVFRVSTPAERDRAKTFVLALGKEVQEAAALNREKCKPFQETLRTGNRWVVVTPVILVINAAVLVGLLLEPGSS